MTGLDVDTDHIIEMACLVTDRDLKVVAEVRLYFDKFQSHFIKEITVKQTYIVLFNYVLLRINVNVNNN